MLWAGLIYSDVSFHAQDGDVRDCRLDENYGLLPTMFGFTIAHQTLWLLLLLAGCVDLITSVRRIVRPDNVDLCETVAFRTGAVIFVFSAEVVISLIAAVFFLSSPDKTSCFAHHSFVLYAVWALPGMACLAVFCPVFLGIICCLLYSVCRSVWHSLLKSIHYCREAYIEANSYNSCDEQVFSDAQKV